MRLIGMLDSPYVRRVAISLTLMDVKFRHEALSVFRNWDAFAAINPVVKAPTAVTDSGRFFLPANCGGALSGQRRKIEHASS